MQMVDTRTRLLVLAALAVVGSGLAGAGIALGVENHVTSDPMGEVSIIKTNVTVASSDGDVVLTENVSETSDIQLSKGGDRITIVEQADEDIPLTPRDRQRAVEIARTNATIESYLETTANATISVEPIKKMSATEMERQTVDSNLNRTESTIASAGTVRVVNVTIEESNESITVGREPSYVDDQAVVRIGSPGRETPKYSVQVDLENGTIIDTTYWDTIGE